VLGLFTGEPAPPAVKEAVARVDRDAPPGMSPNVAAGQTRELMQLNLSNGETAVLWVAPTRSGGLCVYVQRSNEPVKDGPGCEPARTSEPPISWTLQGPAEGAAPIVLLFGRVSLSDAAQVELVFEDGRSMPAAIDRGFFLVEIPSSQHSVGHRVALLRARDAAGRVVATSRVVAGFGIYPGDESRP
jgi:hypothetical protein